MNSSGLHCEECSTYLANLKFCTHCGKRNPRFSEEMWRAGQGMFADGTHLDIPLADVMAGECKKGHPFGHTFMRTMKDFPPKKRVRFCPYCGADLQTFPQGPANN